MIQGNRLTIVPALALALVAGSVSTASAQILKQERTAQPGETRADQTLPAGVDFRSTKWLKGRDVINPAGDKVADVSDLILDRGSGRADYIVVRPGITGKTVALPYTSFAWDATKEKFILNLTKDQLKQYPDFDADKWSAMMESKDRTERKILKDAEKADPKRAERDADKDQAERQRAGREREANRNQPERRDQGNWDRDSMLYEVQPSPDLYAGKYDTTRQVHIEGEVKKVDRVRTATGDEDVVITVATNDGTTKKISLGPSWFVGGGAVSPMRGDKIVADAYTVKGENEVYTAAQIQIGGRDARLRQKGGDAWWASNKVETGDRTYSTPFWHYVLASHVRGMNVECRGERCGEVEDVIVDRNSGEIALMAIDPDEKFLGMGDAKRLVPWSVASIGLDGKVRIDASKEMILASPVMPKELRMLNTGTVVPMVYGAYGVQLPEFQPRRAARDNDRQIGQNNRNDRNLERDAWWGAKGHLATSVDQKSSKTLSGKIVEIKDVSFEHGTQPGRALKVKTDDGREEIVIIGPVWYVDAQDNAYRAGEPVRLEVLQANVNGKPYWIITSMDYNGKRTALWENDRPVWDDR